MTGYIDSAFRFSLHSFPGRTALGSLGHGAGHFRVPATPVSSSTGRASSIAIRQNILAMKQASILRQIKEAQLCIQNASNPTILRDPEGNINRVPSTDLTTARGDWLNCSPSCKPLRGKPSGFPLMPSSRPRNYKDKFNGKRVC